MKKLIAFLLLFLSFYVSKSQNIPSEWTSLVYDLPLNSGMEEIVASAKKLRGIRTIDDSNGLYANLDSTDKSIIKPDVTILNINSGRTVLENNKFAQTIITTIKYSYSAKNSAITTLETLRNTLTKNTVSYSITSQESNVKGVFGNECLLKNNSELPRLSINLEKEDKNYLVIVEVTKVKE